MSENQTVTLVSQEGHTFDTPICVAKMSELVKTMIESNDDDDNDEIDLEQNIPRTYV